MDSVVERCRYAHSNRNALGGVGCRCYNTSEIITHHLLADEVCSLHHCAIYLNRCNAILFELLVVLVVAIVAVSIGVMSCGVDAPLIVENMAYDELIIRLRVVVGVVVIVAYNLSIDDYLALRVVTAIFGHLLGCYTRVGESNLCHATK